MQRDVSRVSRRRPADRRLGVNYFRLRTLARLRIYLERVSLRATFLGPDIHQRSSTMGSSARPASIVRVLGRGWTRWRPSRQPWVCQQCRQSSTGKRLLLFLDVVYRPVYRQLIRAMEMQILSLITSFLLPLKLLICWPVAFCLFFSKYFLLSRAKVITRAKCVNQC